MEAEHVRDAEETGGGAWPVDGWLSGAPAGTGLYAQLKRNVLKDLGRPSRPPQPRATWPSSPRCSAPESSWVAMSVVATVQAQVGSAAAVRAREGDPRVARFARHRRDLALRRWIP